MNKAMNDLATSLRTALEHASEMRKSLSYAAIAAYAYTDADRQMIDDCLNQAADLTGKLCYQLQKLEGGKR